MYHKTLIQDEHHSKSIEHAFAKEVRQTLNHGANELDKATLERLQSIRQRALAKQSLSDKPSWVVSMLSQHPALVRLTRLQVLLPMALLIAGLGGSVAYWHKTMQVQENTDDAVEAYLLGEDLPVGAYLDKDFAQWLGKSKQRTHR